MGSRVRQFRRHVGLASAVALCVLLSGAVVGGADGASPRIAQPDREFRFARLIYSGNMFGGGGGRGGSGAWSTDAPEAELHLLMGIRRLTRIDAIDSQAAWETLRQNGMMIGKPAAAQRDEFIFTDLLDPSLYEFPFLYGVEVGNWYLGEDEADALREYLERGGFLMVDDFHGSAEWEGFMESMERVFPDRPVVEIPDDHEVFHVLYDLDHKVQIPGIGTFRRGGGQTWERDGYTPHWRGVFDDAGRLMVAINFNMDLGDAWEHADAADYPQPLTALAYRFAISYALYAMTH
jgi:hypothetical protein